MREFLTMGLKEISKTRWVKPSGIGVKPRVGGLWASSYRPGLQLKSAWMEWCSYEMPHWVKNFGVVFTLKEDAKIFRLDTMEDYKRLLDNYSAKDTTGIDDGYFAMIDYEFLAKDYQAFEITERAEQLTRFSRPALYGIDCESVLVLDLNCIDTQKYVEW